MGGGCCGFGPFGFSLAAGLLILLFFLLILAGVGLLVVWLVRQTGARQAGPATGGEQALRILQERYARGEITHDEYEQMRRTIEGR